MLSIKQMQPYVTHRIKETDIGVVTPYKSQHENLVERLHRAHNWTGILIGSAEVFQGKERKIMIISTVRSDRLSFVSEPRVSLTRKSYIKKNMLVINRHCFYSTANECDAI